jgi:hypothetical protein
MLFPDLVLVSDEDNKIIIVEIKRSNQTAREALTELLAYDHEVKNLLPFLSNFEVLFCIISTDYSTLLDHSITGLTTWESKQVLCLQVSAREEIDLQLSIHIPKAWTSFGNSELPYTAISTSNITLMKRNKESLNIECIASYAASLIAREGDRNNSHGFVFLWQDCWNLADLGDDAYYLTVGFMNPYAFAPMLQKSEVAGLSKTPLGQYVLEDYCGLSHHYICEEALEKGLAFLGKHFYIDIEGTSNWNDYRLKPYQVQYQPALMCHRALPQRVELWGLLGDFSRELIVHPGVDKYTLSKFSNKTLGCENPFFALPLIDSISGARAIDSRGFTCKSIFDMGVSLASLAGLYNTGIELESKGSDLKSLPASIAWCIVDLIPLLLEVGQQYELSDGIKEPPPSVKIRLNEDFQESRASIEVFINWMFSTFIGEGHAIHKECFSIALSMYVLLDEYFKCCTPEEVIKTIEGKTVISSVNILQWVLSITQKEYILQDLKDSIQSLFINDYLEEPITIDDQSDLELFINEVTLCKHIELYPDTLISMIDKLVLPIDHRVPPERKLSNYSYIDWRWIRDEIDNFRERGVTIPAVTVDLAEQIGIIDISGESYASTLNIDFEKQFIYVIPDKTMTMAIVQQWSTLID